ncbi:GGDEF domain-containing protein [Metabacillus fastidiosus]|uniref:GGDEF domain-containing protein n=1 Tax=Metabacillus fastidiosus TaxID=1458 RepID=UPI001F402BA5|nr:diguanylate cyclase [Metabacillus fastidiosus]MED4463793.1 diguanylate cyclase [Metabacillus fastidiosus]
MFKDLFTNITVLVSLLIFYCQMTNAKPLTRHSPIRRKITVGIAGGLLGNILMYYSISIDAALIDLRHIPLILVAFYGGTLPALLSMLLIILGRMFIAINIPAFTSIILIILVTAASLILAKTTLSKKMKIFLILTFDNFIFSIIVSSLLHDPYTLAYLIPFYSGASYIGGFIAFYVLNVLRTNQMLFKKYKSESTTDALTGLNNYRNFDEKFNDLVKTVIHKKEQLSLLYIDIDFFKKVNDTYGHAEGDEVLKQLGEILQKCSRSFDIISRNGGEEFTVLLRNSSLTEARETAEKIRRSVEKHSFQLKNNHINVTVSIGVACFRETTDNIYNLIEDADKSLYQAKNTGRNKVCIALSH